MLTYPTDEPVVFITMGDPAGIGPEVVVKALERIQADPRARLIIVADREVISSLAGGVLEADPRTLEVENFILPEGPGIYLADPAEDMSVTSSVPTPEGSMKAKMCIDTALRLMRQVPSSVGTALVTAPVSKQHFHDIAPGFIGHTEYLRDFYSKGHVTMAMVGKRFSVAPLTRHIPLRDVPGRITFELIKGAVDQLMSAGDVLSRKADPVLGICALNPHAGEGGRIGVEENETIGPAVSELQRDYPSLVGPLPADVAFYKAYKGELDIVLGMYHDQCLAPFKMLDFEEGVNVTLGLDHFRASPDHGTAFDIAGSSKASPLSMLNAILLAREAACPASGRE